MKKLFIFIIVLCVMVAISSCGSCSSSVNPISNTDVNHDANADPSDGEEAAFAALNFSNGPANAGTITVTFGSSFNAKASYALYSSENACLPLTSQDETTLTLPDACSNTTVWSEAATAKGEILTKNIAANTLTATLSSANIENAPNYSVIYYLYEIGKGLLAFATLEYTAPATSSKFTTRSSHTSVVHNGAIYVIGGIDDTSYRNDVWASSDDGATWEEVGNTSTTPRFSARFNHKSVVHNGAIYVIGGIDDTGYRNDVWASGDNGVTWQEVNGSAAFDARSLFASVVHNGAIYVIGGVNNITKGNFNDVWASSDDGVTWQQVTSGASNSFTARFGLEAVVNNGNIFVIAGREINHYNDVWASSDNGVTWQEVNDGASNSFTARFTHEAVVNNGNLYVIAGLGEINHYNDVWASSDNGLTWSQVGSTSTTPRFSSRQDHTSVVHNNAIYVIGGVGADINTPLNDVWSSTDGITWKKRNSLSKWNESNAAIEMNAAQ